MPRRDDHPAQPGPPDIVAWRSAEAALVAVDTVPIGHPAAGGQLIERPGNGPGNDSGNGSGNGRQSQEGQEAQAPGRPGQIDPQAAPRFGSSPYPGLPHPLGATPYQGGTNFAVVADGIPGVSDVQLCLIDADGAERVLPMEERTYGIWHTFVPDVGPGQIYGFRVPARDPAKILLDPYARQVTSTQYDLIAAASTGVDTLGKVPLAVVVANVDRRNKSTSMRPFVPWEQTVIYEAHVVGLTKLHPELPAELRGTFKGVAHPAVIEHLKSLSVTTLELLPVQASAAEPGLLATNRRNYWGYSTLSYFAPHPGYASEPGQEIAEFIEMVDALHAAGIEVVLDVVYNHTCEGGPGLTADLSWRGLAPDSYYLPDGRDITGTGNTVNAGTLPVVRMVTDSLRYWADFLGVDGFRFDLASVHGRPGGGPFDPGFGTAHRDRRRPDPVRPQADRRAMGRHRRGLRGRRFRRELDGMERPVPGHHPGFLAGHRRHQGSGLPAVRVVGSVRAGQAAVGVDQLRHRP